MVRIFTPIIADDTEMEHPISHTRMYLLCVCIFLTSYMEELPGLCGELADSIVTFAAASCVFELLVRSSIVVSFRSVSDINITTSLPRYAIFAACLTKQSQEINSVLHDRVATIP